eukprot:GHVS01028170.1.p2 GENE.GHVS01028170.1~~GHVS01028170.1.p2  ORF type:complete len:143 (+),score=7.13 GHVS01028170.1:1174-1602(+)
MLCRPSIELRPAAASQPCHRVRIAVRRILGLRHETFGLAIVCCLLTAFDLRVAGPTADHTTFTASYPSGSGTIYVIDSRYGKRSRIDNPAPNAGLITSPTSTVSTTCNGRTSCSFLVIDTSLGGDPEVGIGKQFKMWYQCRR